MDNNVVEALSMVVNPVIFNVPVVVKFSFPKLIAPVSEFIWANLTIPVEEAVVKVEFPVTPNVPVIEVLPVSVETPVTDRVPVVLILVPTVVAA